MEEVISAKCHNFLAVREKQGVTRNPRSVTAPSSGSCVGLHKLAVRSWSACFSSRVWAASFCTVTIRGHLPKVHTNVRQLRRSFAEAAARRIPRVTSDWYLLLIILACAFSETAVIWGKRSAILVIRGKLYQLQRTIRQAMPFYGNLHALFL